MTVLKWILEANKNMQDLMSVL